MHDKSVTVQESVDNHMHVVYSLINMNFLLGIDHLVILN